MADAEGLTSWLKSQGLSDVPVIKFEWHPESKAYLDSLIIETPLDYMGLKCFLDGVRYHYTKLLGKGDTAVVFELTNPDTLETRAIKDYLCNFDERRQLQNKLNHALRNTNGIDNRLVVELCDRLLLIDPNDDISLYHKALMLEGSNRLLEDSLALIDRAIEINPHDLINRCEKVIILLKLDEVTEAVDVFEEAYSINNEGLSRILSEHTGPFTEKMLNLFIEKSTKKSLETDVAHIVNFLHQILSAVNH